MPSFSDGGLEIAMYKLQMKFQRLVTFLCLAAAALTFIYSLGCMTDVYFLYKIEALDFVVPGADMFYKMQPFNKTFTNVSIVLILLAVSCLVFNNHTRRKYYIGNYITTLVSSVANIGVAIWGITNVFKYKAMFLEVEFEAIAEIADSVPPSVLIRNGIDPENLAGPYSTFWFDISVVVFGILIIATILNLLNMWWKISVMSKETKALRKRGR